MAISAEVEEAQPRDTSEEKRRNFASLVAGPKAEKDLAAFDTADRVLVNASPEVPIGFGLKPLADELTPGVMVVYKVGMSDGDKADQDPPPPQQHPIISNPTPDTALLEAAGIDGFVEH